MDSHTKVKAGDVVEIARYLPSMAHTVRRTVKLWKDSAIGAKLLYNGRFWTVERVSSGKPDNYTEV